MRRADGTDAGRVPVEEATAGIGALADPVRRALYDAVVGAREPVSRDAAAAAVGIAHHQAKFHLDRLEAEGLLTSQLVRTSGRSGPGAGRPAKVYRRSGREFAISLPARGYELAGRLMAAGIAESAATGEPVRPCLERGFAEFGADAGREAAAAPDAPADPLDGVCVALAPHGYEPRREGDRVELANCPFHTLAQDETELVCGLNHCLVAGVADALAPGELDARLEPGAQRCCVVVQRTGEAGAT